MKKDCHFKQSLFIAQGLQSCENIFFNKNVVALSHKNPPQLRWVIYYCSRITNSRDQVRIV